MNESEDELSDEALYLVGVQLHPDTGGPQLYTVLLMNEDARGGKDRPLTDTDGYIKVLDRTAYLCDECDALWLNAAEIGVTGFVDFDTFMKDYGRSGLWSEIIVLEDAGSV